MPRGDRTGPRSEGPETGRGAGWCHSGDRPGYESAPGFGRGWRTRNSGRRWSGSDRGRQFLPSRNLVSRRMASNTEHYSLVELLDLAITLVEKLNAVRKNRS